MSYREDLVVRRHQQPSALGRLWSAIRSFTIGPLSLRDPALLRFFGGGTSSAGISVSEDTALNFSAVWAATSLIAGDLASLPLITYRRSGGAKRRDFRNPLYRLLHDEPNPETSSYTFRETLQGHVLLWGNGFAEIERDGVGRPKYLWQVTPDRVTPYRDVNGRLAYRVTNYNRPASDVPAADMLHIRGLGFDGVQGYSVIAKARESVGLGVAAERFGSAFFGNGSTFGGVLSHPTRFNNAEAKKSFIDALRSRSQGVDKAHNFLVLEDGIRYERIGIPPEEAQFLQMRKFQVTEIARWFNVPPHKLGDLERATFSNIEQQSIDYVTTTLRKWLVAWEQELTRKLISKADRASQFVEFVPEGLLRGDAASRGAFYEQLFRLGAITPDEIRARENMNPLPGDAGKQFFVTEGVRPIDQADEPSAADDDDKAARAIVYVNATPHADAQREPSTASRQCSSCQRRAVPGTAWCALHAPEHLSSGGTNRRSDTRTPLDARQATLDQAQRELAEAEEKQNERVKAWMRRFHLLSEIEAVYPGYASELREQGWPDHVSDEAEAKVRVIVPLVRRKRQAARSQRRLEAHLNGSGRYSAEA